MRRLCFQKGIIYPKDRLKITGPIGWLLSMETGIPNRLGPAYRAALWGAAPFVFFMASVVEGAIAGNYLVAGICAILFILSIPTIVYWDSWGSRMSSAQAVLFVGIIGTWLFVTVGLGAAAWMIWSQQGFTIGSSAIGVGAKLDDRPLQWVYSFTLEGGFGRNIFSLTFRGANTSKHPIQIKDANIISLIDGTVLPLEIVGVDPTTDENRIAPIDRVQLIVLELQSSLWPSLALQTRPIPEKSWA